MIRTMKENILIKFLILAKRCGGIRFHKLLSLLPMFIKGTLLYPFSLIDHFLYHERIKNHQLSEDPIFILGYYRSGTTFLQRVLALNSDWANINQLHTAIPECSISFSRFFMTIFQFFSKLLKSKNEFHKTEWDWNLVGEEDVGLTCLASEATCYWSFMFPSKAEEYFDRFSYFKDENQKDINFWKDEYTHIVKRFSFMFKGQQMLLKSPPNVAKIKELIELYPKAKFIFIYRNPYQVLKSVRRLWAINGKMNFQNNPSPEVIDQLTIKDFSSSIDRYYKYKSLVSPSNIFEIKYEDFMSDPKSILENLWSTFNLKNSNIISSMVEYIKKHDGEGVTQHKFDHKDFELAEKDLHKYIDLWGYQRPKT